MTEKHALQETTHLVYDLPSEWYSQKMSPLLKRDRMVLRLSEWSKGQSMTPELLLKLIQGPLSQAEIRKYTSNQLARIVHSVGLMKKQHRLVAEPHIIKSFLDLLVDEATVRKRLITYDGMGLAQVAFGFSMMQLEDARVFRSFAEEAIKPYRIRNTLGKSVVNLLDAFYAGKYSNSEHIKILSQAAVSHLPSLPTFALPKLLNAWGHFRYDNDTHVRATLAEMLKENRLNGMLAKHLEEVLIACARLKFCEPKIVMLFVREIIYSHKWKYLSDGSLCRIIWAMGELQHEHSNHWKEILKAAMQSERISSIDSHFLVDIYIGWSKVNFRDSRLLELLGKEATHDIRIADYSTKQLFEIFKGQRALGQLEKVYAQPIIDRLKDTEKLMKCNLETKIKIFLYPNMKKTLGMKNIASIAKEIFQPACLDEWDNSVLMHLAHGLSVLGPRFNICFGEIALQLRKEERMKQLTAKDFQLFFTVWREMEYENEEDLGAFAAECSTSHRLESYTEEELLKITWMLYRIGKAEINSTDPQLIRPLMLEAMKRPMSVFTTKGLMMLLKSAATTQCLEKSEILPVIQSITEDKRAEEWTPTEAEKLKILLKQLGYEDDAEKITCSPKTDP